MRYTKILLLIIFAFVEGRGILLRAQMPLIANFNERKKTALANLSSKNNPDTARINALIEVFRIWNRAYQPAELLIFDVPNFSMTEKLWGARLFDWMRSRSILPAESQ